MPLFWCYFCRFIVNLKCIGIVAQPNARLLSELRQLEHTALLTLAVPMMWIWAFACSWALIRFVLVFIDFHNDIKRALVNQKIRSLHVSAAVFQRTIVDKFYTIVLQKGFNRQLFDLDRFAPTKRQIAATAHAVHGVNDVQQIAFRAAALNKINFPSRGMLFAVKLLGGRAKNGHKFAASYNTAFGRVHNHAFCFVLSAH